MDPETDLLTFLRKRYLSQTHFSLLIPISWHLSQTLGRKSLT